MKIFAKPVELSYFCITIRFHALFEHQMKKFFIAFLGSLAGIWFSLFIAFVGFTIIIAAAAASSIGSKTVSEIKNNSYLNISMSGAINERPGMVKPIEVLQGIDKELLGLNEIVGAIRSAATDDCISGIFIDCKGSSAGLAQRQAILEALKEFKGTAPEKWIYAYADAYTQGDYYVASVADSLFLNPIGMADIHGLSSTNLYFKNLLDKMGVEMQVVKVGTYKSAVEPFLLDKMSEPAREQQELYLNNMWKYVAGEIAESRGVTVADVNAWADSLVFTTSAENLVKLKVVDRLLYRHEMDEKLEKLTNVDSVDDLPAVGVSDYCSARDIYKKGKGKGAKIGVLYATGDITDEEGDGIVASKLVPEILNLADEDNLDGLVLCVNSGGGSAFASEQIWEALQQWKKITGKPLYVSMSDYAASGGYYISCGADRIYAQPTTLTGSIGIFGMIPNAHGLIADKLGVNTSTVSTNPRAVPISIMDPMTPAQRSAMQAYVEQGYELFTRRCAEGRGMSQDSIKAIAEGRVWDGAEALRIGLVDELGGLDKAIAGMAKKLNVETWKVIEYPVLEPKWYDIVLKAGVDFKASLVDEELGEMKPLYETLRQVKGLAPVQARMGFFEVNL